MCQSAHRNRVLKWWHVALKGIANRGQQRGDASLRLDCANSAISYPPFVMSDNKKQEKDYTPEVNALLPEAETLAKVPSASIVVPNIGSITRRYSQGNSRKPWTNSLLLRNSQEMCACPPHSHLHCLDDSEGCRSLLNDQAMQSSHSALL